MQVRPALHSQSPVFGSHMLRLQVWPTIPDFESFCSCCFAIAWGVCSVCVQVFMHTSSCVYWVHCLGTLTQMQEKGTLFLHLSLLNFFFFLSKYLSPNVKLAIWLHLLASELLKSLALCPPLLEFRACAARSIQVFCEWWRFFFFHSSCLHGNHSYPLSRLLGPQGC